jgi:ribosomal protein S18 acetylase RimI-like enzyme
MKLNLEYKLPDWLHIILAPFGIQPIDFSNPLVRCRAIQHMCHAFGTKEGFVNQLVRMTPDPERDRVRERLYEMDIDLFVGPHKACWESPDGFAAAWWTPPTVEKLSAWQMLQLVPTGMQILGLLGAIKGFGALQEMDAARPSEPHWYLNNLAVDKIRQGEHYGSALLVPILWLADDKNYPVFLMIANPDNQRYYERFGFHLVREELQPQFGPEIPFFKAMLRRPGTIEMTPDNVKKLLAC